MKSEERRAAIVRSAIHLFAEKGFRGTITRELAAAAGVTEPVLYQHFRAKRDLHSAIIEAKAGEVSEHAVALAGLALAGDDRVFFGAVGELILRSYQAAKVGGSPGVSCRVELYMEAHPASSSAFETRPRFTCLKHVAPRNRH